MSSVQMYTHRYIALSAFESIYTGRTHCKGHKKLYITGTSLKGFLLLMLGLAHKKKINITKI